VLIACCRRDLITQSGFGTDGLPDIVNVVAYHHLKLTTTFHDHNHARIFLQVFSVGFLVIFQFEAKSGCTMNQTDDVIFATNMAQDILRQRLIFHLGFLKTDARRHPLTELKIKKPENLLFSEDALRFCLHQAVTIRF
jgi:hypothetical protein